MNSPNKGPDHPDFDTHKEWVRECIRAYPGVIFTLQYKGQTIYRRRRSEYWQPRKG